MESLERRRFENAAAGRFWRLDFVYPGAPCRAGYNPRRAAEEED